MPALVEISDLQFAYPKHEPILHIKKLVINEGERIFLFGPSGSGKSTLLSLLAGMLPVKEGSLSVLGNDYGSMKPSARDKFRGKHIGYIFQMLNLVPYLTVEENIWLPVKMRGLSISEELQQRHNNLLHDLNIAEIITKKTTAISVGQAQRVACARALLSGPEIVLADEPTSSLDFENREAFIKALFESAKRCGSTIIFVSHDTSLQPLFDRVVSLSEINILADVSVPA